MRFLVVLLLPLYPPRRLTQIAHMRTEIGSGENVTHHLAREDIRPAARLILIRIGARIAAVNDLPRCAIIDKKADGGTAV